MENFTFGLYSHLKRIENIKLIANKRSYRGLLPFSLYILIYTLLFSYRYDLVYCNDILTCFFAFPAKIIYRKPMVSTLFGLDLNFVLKGDVTLTMKILKKIYKGIISFPKRYVNEFIPISKGTAQLAKKCGIKTHRIITPGIEKTDIHISKSIKEIYRNKIRKKYSINKQKKILLFLGRIIKRKGLHWFLENIFFTFKDTYQLIIVGGGNDIEDAKRIITKYHFDKHTNILGRVPENLKQTLFLGSDIFILPNIKVKDHWEGFGMVAIEASQYGTPVVAASLEGITSAVIPNKNGLLYRPGYVKDCIEKINTVSQWEINPNKISKFTNENFSNERLARLYSEAFLSILKKE